MENTDLPINRHCFRRVLETTILILSKNFRKVIYITMRGGAWR